MTQPVAIRETVTVDIAGLQILYRAAFPDEDLFPLVDELLGGSAPLISLAAVVEEQLVGHVIFTLCSVAPGNEAVALLGPLCVSPGLQKRGIGSNLVTAGFDRLRESDVTQVFVLGDPAYYSRFGFNPGCGVDTPCPIPVGWKEAWQSVRLDGSGAPTTGKLIVPRAWSKPSLWS
ncbi:N-acetyltransferase [Labrenzia sp. DG1229]|uniref:GNAT family N-acetyltransferase n=1 Tax=Labrenzia sp. DG1229 TaxID=681847 RepID=UPI00048FC420|nr:N-acetyltransferase [Labrenzia sp. DG1229]